MRQTVMEAGASPALDQTGQRHRLGFTELVRQPTSQNWVRVVWLFSLVLGHCR